MSVQTLLCLSVSRYVRTKAESLQPRKKGWLVNLTETTRYKSFISVELFCYTNSVINKYIYILP